MAKEAGGWRDDGGTTGEAVRREERIAGKDVKKEGARALAPVMGEAARLHAVERPARSERIQKKK
jgi:hypothetical protein